MLHAVAVAPPALEDGMTNRSATGGVGHSSDILRDGVADDPRQRPDSHSRGTSGDEPTPTSGLCSSSKVRVGSCDGSNSNEEDNSATHTASHQSSQSTIQVTHLTRAGLDSPGGTVLLPAAPSATCELDLQPRAAAEGDYAAAARVRSDDAHEVHTGYDGVRDIDGDTELQRGVTVDTRATTNRRAARERVVLTHAQLSPAGSDDESAVARLPPSLALRPERTLRALQHLATFGCCIFFFPTPVISWLFPLAGHVGLSNAEGTMLYTFESSYFVREERVAEVLSAVLPRTSPQSPTRASIHGPAADSGVTGRTSQHGSRSGTFGAGHVSESGSTALETSQTSLHSPSSNDVSTHSTSGGGTASQAAAMSSPTGRHARMSPNTAGATGHKRSVTGHAHCRCVCIWDLKPLLLKSYGRGAMRSSSSTGAAEGTTQEMPSAGALWARLQELLQGSSGGDASREDGGGADETVEATASQQTPRGVPQVDKDLARIYNQHLQDTVKVFRASADGSNNSPDVLLQHSNSFSFVGFVLEACELGRATRGAAQSSPARAATTGTSSTPTRAVSADEAPVAGDGNAATATPSPVTVGASDTVEEIHWGVPKVLFHIWRFGRWYRDERWSHYLLYGGNVAIAGALWCVLFAIGLHYAWLLLATRL